MCHDLSDLVQCLLHWPPQWELGLIPPGKHAGSICHGSMTTMPGQVAEPRRKPMRNAKHARTVRHGKLHAWVWDQQGVVCPQQETLGVLPAMDRVTSRLKSSLVVCWCRASMHLRCSLLWWCQWSSCSSVPNGRTTLGCTRCWCCCFPPCRVLSVRPSARCCCVHATRGPMCAPGSQCLLGMRQDACIAACR